MGKLSQWVDTDRTVAKYKITRPLCPTDAFLKKGSWLGYIICYVWGFGWALLAYIGIAWCGSWPVFIVNFFTDQCLMGFQFISGLASI